MRSDNVKVTLFRSYNVFILFFIVGTTVMEVHAQYNQEIVSMFNNAFRMLFKLARDCSASGMFDVNNVTSFPAPVRKLVFFYQRVKGSQIIVLFMLLVDLANSVEIYDY